MVSLAINKDNTDALIQPFQYPLYSASLAEYNMEQVSGNKIFGIKDPIHKEALCFETMAKLFVIFRWVITWWRKEVGHWTLLSLRGLTRLPR